MDDLRTLIRALIESVLEEDELVEFSGAGAVAGYTLPLGMKPSRPHTKKEKKKIRKRPRK